MELTRAVAVDLVEGGQQRLVREALDALRD
jgi:hypothetical protein